MVANVLGGGVGPVGGLRSADGSGFGCSCGPELQGGCRSTLCGPNSGRKEAEGLSGFFVGWQQRFEAEFFEGDVAGGGE